MAAAPTLSVVLASAHPGPELDALLEILLPQLGQVGGELVLIDGSADGLPWTEHASVAVTLIRATPGDDVFSMRARGADLARGWVIAFAEDHCMPSDGMWARAVLDAHIANGHRAAVTGAVSNGTPHTMWDRANFLMSFAGVLDPMLANRRPPGTPPIANTSIKREVLLTHHLTPGFLELELLPHLVAVDHVAPAPGVRMTHHQHRRLGDTLAAHFHNGRATSGLGPGRDGVDRLRGIASSMLLVPRHTLAVTRELRRRPGRRRVAAAIVPFVAVLATAHAVGQIVGLCAGPGRSPAALE